MSTGYLCSQCGFVGPEVETRTTREKLDEFGAINQTYDCCPDCSSDDLHEITMCEDCEACGEHVESYQDDLCKSHWDEQQVGAAEFKRDAITETRLLLKETGS
jgi:hypothetical protein